MPYDNQVDFFELPGGKTEERKRRQLVQHGCFGPFNAVGVQGMFDLLQAPRFLNKLEHVVEAAASPSLVLEGLPEPLHEKLGKSLLSGVPDLLHDLKRSPDVVKGIPVIGDERHGATRKMGTGDLRLQFLEGRLRRLLLSQVDQHILRHVVVRGKLFEPGLLHRIRNQRFEKNPVKIYGKHLGPCLLLVVGKPVAQAEVEIGKRSDLIHGHVLHAAMAEERIQHFFFHVRRIEILLKLEGAHLDRVSFGLISSFRFENMREKEEIFLLFFRPEIDLYFPPRFQGNPVGNDKDLPVRLEKVIDLADNVVSVFFQVFLRNHPPRPGAELFHEHDLVDVSRQDHEIKRLGPSRKFFEGVEKNKLVLPEAEGKVVDHQVFRIGQESDSVAFLQVLLAVKVDDFADFVRLALDGRQRREDQ